MTIGIESEQTIRFDKEVIPVMSIFDSLGRFWSGAEVIYGVIIAVTFTSTLRSSFLDVQEFYSTIIFSALFCCIAWGVADGLFYAWENRYTTNNQRKILRLSKSEEGRNLAASLIEEQLKDTIVGVIESAERRNLYDRIAEYLSTVDIEIKPSFKKFPSIVFATFLLSTGAGVIVLVPFFVLGETLYALNVSNMLGIVLLFLIGFFRVHEKSLIKKLVSGTVAAWFGLIIMIITVVLGG